MVYNNICMATYRHFRKILYIKRNIEIMTFNYDYIIYPLKDQN